MKGHDKYVSSIALDPSGARCVTGSYDYTMKFFDFAGMNESMKAFRSVEPDEGHPIRQVNDTRVGTNGVYIPRILYSFL